MDAAMKNAAISAAILARVQAGESLPSAMDAVLGVGSYAKVACATYDALRAGK